MNASRAELLVALAKSKYKDSEDDRETNQKSMMDLLSLDENQEFNEALLDKYFDDEEKRQKLSSVDTDCNSQLSGIVCLGTSEANNKNDYLNCTENNADDVFIMKDPDSMAMNIDFQSENTTIEENGWQGTKYEIIDGNDLIKSSENYVDAIDDCINPDHTTPMTMNSYDDIITVEEMRLPENDIAVNDDDDDDVGVDIIGDPDCDPITVDSGTENPTIEDMGLPENENDIVVNNYNDDDDDVDVGDDNIIGDPDYNPDCDPITVDSDTENPTIEGPINVEERNKRKRNKNAEEETSDQTTENISVGLEKGMKKQCRWKKSDESTWKYNVAKKRRSELQSYEIKNVPRPAKTPKKIDCEKCRFKCNQKFSELDRQSLCAAYWKLSDFNHQKDFLLARIKSCLPERRRPKNDEAKCRQNSKQYYFEFRGNNHRVCQSFFLKTLCISNVVVLNAFKYRGELGSYEGCDRRGRKEPANKTSPEEVELVKKHIESFPTMESHYSRKTTKRQYLDSTLSISKMYSLYKEEFIKRSDAEGKSPVSLITYKRIFGNEYNLSFFKPKKDMCQICFNYEEANEELKRKLQDDYESHQRRKVDCYNAKDNDKKRAAEDKNFRTASFDLQSVLQIPSSDVSLMYYSRKLVAYNLTIYEGSIPNDAFCFAWTELNGKRGSSEIGSCLYEYLMSLPAHVNEISLFSDTCGGQNRNKQVAALLLYISQKSENLNIIEHKFLESGHSYMEADSMHSAIESAKKHVPVYTMQDWLTIFRLARSNRVRNKTSMPYKVREMKYSNFFDLKQLSETLIRNRTKNMNGDQVNWLLIKSMRFSKTKPGIMEYKYEHKSEYSSMNVFGKGRHPAMPDLQGLYKTQLPISVQKKKDLLNLCKKMAIPEEFHSWYKQLPSNKAIVNKIPEPSAGDVSSSDEQENENDPL